MILCPECSHEVSNTAVACPNCGHPMSPPVVQTETFIRDVPPPVIERETFPRWIFIPLGVLGFLLVLVIFLLMRDGQEDQQNINVKLRTGQTGVSETNRTISQTTAPNEVTVPATTQTETVTVPRSNDTTATVNPPQTSSVTNVPADTAQVPSQGKVNVELKVKDRRTNKPRAVSAEKVYLLDKSLDAILREADLQNTTGQSLTQAFGLSVVYPDRYGDLNSKALSAINKHIKYDTITDGGGKAEISGVEPKNYYLFAITQTDGGFALWNSSITIKPGDNVLNLSANPTIIRDQNNE